MSTDERTLLKWVARDNVIWAQLRKAPGETPDEKVVGVMASSDLAAEAAEAHNKALTGRYE